MIQAWMSEHRREKGKTDFRATFIQVKIACILHCTYIVVT